MDLENTQFFPLKKLFNCLTFCFKLNLASYLKSILDQPKHLKKYFYSFRFQVFIMLILFHLNVFESGYDFPPKILREFYNSYHKKITQAKHKLVV